MEWPAVGETSLNPSAAFALVLASLPHMLVSQSHVILPYRKIPNATINCYVFTT